MSERILIVGPAWVGDMIMAGQLFRLLKAEDTTREITVVAPPATAPLLDFMSDVDRTETLAVRSGQGGLHTRWHLGRRLAKARYDRALILPRSIKAALVPFLAGVPKRIGYRGEPRWGLLTEVRRFDREAVPRTVDRFLALGRPRGAAVPSLPGLRFKVPPKQIHYTCNNLGLSKPSRPLLALCPGAAYGPAKRWPAAHFAAVATAWRANGGAVWVFGQEADREAGHEIKAAAPDSTHDLTGRTKLTDAVALLSLADRVVANDSGLMHVAAALDKPLAALYGSSTADETPPLSDAATMLGLDLDCRPCRQRVCPLGHLRCLRDLTPEMVLAALDKGAC